MPAVQTLAQLRRGVLRRGNFENDPNVVAPDEDGFTPLDEAINDAVLEMWGYKAEENPDLLLVLDEIDAETGTQAYDLPEDFGQIRRLDRVDGTDRILVVEAPPLLEVDFSQTGSNTSADGVQYRMIGGGIDGSTAQLYLTPDPGTWTYELWYVQAPQVLDTSDEDSELDTTFGEGRLVQAIATAQLCERQDRDASPHRAEQGRALECCKRLWRKRDAGRPRRITNIRDQAVMAGRRRLPLP